MCVNIAHALKKFIKIGNNAMILLSTFSYVVFRNFFLVNVDENLIWLYPRAKGSLIERSQKNLIWILSHQIDCTNTYSSINDVIQFLTHLPPSWSIGTVVTKSLTPSPLKPWRHLWTGHEMNFQRTCLICTFASGIQVEPW